jgi:hypothetical protein
MKISENKFFVWFGAVIVGLVIFGQFERWQLTPSIAIYAHDIGIFSWLLLFCFQKQKTWQLKLPHWWPFGAWILLGWMLASLKAESVWILIRPILYVIRLSMVWLFATKLADLLSRSEKQRALVALTGIGGIILWLGLMQYFFLPDTRFLKTFGWDDHYYRLIGTLFDPGFTGLVLVMTSLSLFGQKLLTSFKLKTSGVVLLIIGILLTYSRATYLSLLIALGYFGWHSWKEHHQKAGLLAGLAIVVLLAGIPFLPRPTGEGIRLERTSTVVSRWDTTKQALQNLSPLEWLYGRGLFVTKTTTITAENPIPDHAQLPDTILVLLLTSLGFGGIAFGLKYFGRRGVVWWKLQPIWLQSIWLAVIVHSFFNNSLFEPIIWLLLQLWTALGKTDASETIAEK